jgi:hypothetical protein
MTTTDLTMSTETGDLTYLAIQRRRANMLRLAQICVNAACRRAGACSGNPDTCIGCITPYLPEDVCAGVDALLEGELEGITYNEARDEAPIEIGAYEDWLSKIDASMRETVPFMRPKAKHSQRSHLREIS